MPTLMLRLVGPMQSWGTTSRFDERETQLEPSKSGVLGLICAALGRDRKEAVDDLAALVMGVRVDREGVLMRDYHTASGVMKAEGKADLNRTVVSPRYYLADAAFLVGLEGSDLAMLERVQAALQTPVWPLALGRKSFPPSMPVWMNDGVCKCGLREALLAWPRVASPRDGQSNETFRLILEHASEGAVRLDQPVAPYAERLFGPRHVISEVAHVPE